MVEDAFQKWTTVATTVEIQLDKSNNYFSSCCHISSGCNHVPSKGADVTWPIWWPIWCKQDFWVAPYLLWIYHIYVIGNITDHTEKVYNAPNISILCLDLTFIIRNAFECLLANSDIDEINSQVNDIHVYSCLLQSKQQPYPVYVCLLVCVFIFVILHQMNNGWTRQTVQQQH